MLDDVIPPEMWVFFPAATREEVEEYKKWCQEHIDYIPYIDTNIIVFEKEDDTLFFKLAHSELL